MTFLRLGLAVAIMCSLIDTNARAQSVPYGTGDWNADSLGNHRAVIRVHAPAGAVSIRVPWRRRDESPERKHFIVRDAVTDRERTGSVATVVRGRWFEASPCDTIFVWGSHRFGLSIPLRSGRRPGDPIPVSPGQGWLLTAAPVR